ncbi:MAG TPA: DUF92 domain-containing protein [Nitrososphaeraceae archaeon]
MLPLDQSVGWLSVMIALTVVAYRINAIDVSGVIAAVPIGFITLFFGGVTWFLALLSFFLIASYFTKHKYEQKELAGFSEKNRGARGWASVLANGGLPAFFAIIYHFAANNNLYLFFFSGSLAFALADTIATEVGLLSKSTPRSIISGKPILRGHSGGVTLRGENAALAGTVVIGTICGLFFSIDASQFIVILVACIISGMLSTNLDSALGETLQCKYRCTVCNKYSESRIVHCDVVTIQHTGLKFVDNNMVNVISSLIGAGLCSIFVLAFNN